MLFYVQLYKKFEIDYYVMNTKYTYVILDNDDDDSFGCISILEGDVAIVVGVVAGRGSGSWTGGVIHFIFAILPARPDNFYYHLSGTLLHAVTGLSELELAWLCNV